MKIESHGAGLRVECPAKLNLYLEILGKRPDGYHGILTVMQEIGLYDTLEVALEGKEGISFTVSDPTLPQGGDNLVVRAARRFLEARGIERGLRMHLTKKIPAGTGMGGGSGNATAALLALDRLLETRLKPEEITAYAALVGSDCPYFVWGGTAVCSGRGEQVVPQSPLPPYWALIVCPTTATSTAQVYRSLAASSLGTAPPVDLILEELRSGDLGRVRSALFNRLESAALQLHPELASFQEKLVQLGVPTPRLTGSGSAFYGIFASQEEARTLLDSLEKQLGGFHRGAFLAPFCGRGR